MKFIIAMILAIFGIVVVIYNQVQRYEMKKKLDNIELKHKNEELMKFVKNIHDNYDCDEDAHKYNTPCRCCDAEKLWNKYKDNT